MPANATKRLHKFRNRSHFSRDAKRIYEKTYYSHASSVAPTVVQVAYVSYGFCEGFYNMAAISGSNAFAKRISRFRCWKTAQQSVLKFSQEIRDPHHVDTHIIIIIDSTISVFNTDASLSYCMCAFHGCTWARIMSGRPHLDRRTIRVLNQSLWLKSLTARQRCLAGNANALPFLRHIFRHMFQPPSWRASRLCSSDL
ncbi:hypothetical protein CSKR_109357 [Clonorchis sinensis]|uniref:Uncharacterized protein n=1 Tax=Clonorchis sinensis TaxID=79923 RepID=A0A419PNA0_CLOSI|nr:hypothetical protein CSKR_109357 [Clonorchis sinensis]